MTLVDYLAALWLILLVTGATITTTEIGKPRKPREPYTPAVAVLSWVMTLIAFLVVFGVIR